MYQTLLFCLVGLIAIVFLEVMKRKFISDSL